MAVSLKLLCENNIERVMHWRMLPDVTRYMYTDPVLTLDSQMVWFRTMSKSINDIVWTIDLEDHGPVGVLSLGDIDRVNRRCVWAYYLGDDAARGKGLAKPLECNISDFVFDALKMNKLWCEVFSTNDRVVKLHEKFGSKVEGVLRQHIRKGYEVHDVVRMGLLKSDWYQRRQTLTYDKIEIEHPGHFPEFGVEQ